MNPISVAHSPDTDDHFLFWAAQQEKIALDNLKFSYTALDTQALNHAALFGQFDVIAISVGAYPAVADSYLILQHGASIGRNYGPVIAAKQHLQLEELNELRVAIPGASTTAARILKLVAPGAKTVEIPIEPFDLVYHALDRKEVDAAVLIHEGQLMYTARGLVKVADLGELWHQRTGLPLPLGVNVIRRALGPTLIKRISNVLSESIAYALDHTDEVLSYLIGQNRERASSLHSEVEVKKYLSMYANGDTRNLPKDCIEAIDKLIGTELATPAQYVP